jgi:SAM-dependent methyltransferase
VKDDSTSDQFPHSAKRSMAQIEALKKWLGKKPRRVLDLGCGNGRVLIPLAEAGHNVIGVDRNQTMLHLCERALQKRSLRARLIKADILRAIPRCGRFDAVLCLGNTLMTVTSVIDAARLLLRCAKLLKPGGAVLIDDFPHEFWLELTQGRWQTGLSQDHRMQLIWEPGDNVFTIRKDADVDPTCWQIKPRDQRFRLWSMGELTLAARLAGLSAPKWKEGTTLIALARRAGS